MQNNTFSTLFVGQNLIKLKEVDSTNNFLKNLLSNSEPLAEGTVIMADYQYAGRGQMQNVWETLPGKNISMSIYLKPAFLAADMQFYLNMAVSLSVSDALRELIADGITVKWPNDIYYKDKKLGGILIENSLSGSIIKSSVIGIGLNVNQPEFSDQISHRATSVIQILQKSVPLTDIMNKIFVFMEKYYLILKSGRYEFLKAEYLKQLYLFEQPSRYLKNGEVFEGTIKDVERSGRILIDIEGSIEAFNFKEIEFTHTK